MTGFLLRWILLWVDVGVALRLLPTVAAGPIRRDRCDEH